MASLSIPFLFRPVVAATSSTYGDGAMRQTSPLSPAIHLGANRLLIIGVNDPAPAGIACRRSRAVEPTFGQMFGFMLDSLFMDQLQCGSGAHQPLQREPNDAAASNVWCITPSRDVNEIARRHARRTAAQPARAAARHGRQQCAPARCC